MRSKIIEKCLEVVRGVVATNNVGGMGYVEQALRLELEKNEFRNMSIKMEREKNDGH